MSKKFYEIGAKDEVLLADDRLTAGTGIAISAKWSTSEYGMAYTKSVPAVDDLVAVYQDAACTTAHANFSDIKCTAEDTYVPYKNGEIGVGTATLVSKNTISGTVDVINDKTHLLTSGVADAFTAKEYSTGDFVTSDGIAYICKDGYTATSTSAKPAADTVHWLAANLSQLFTDANTALKKAVNNDVGYSDYDSGTTYAKDAVVVYDNQLYVSLKDSNTDAPTVTTSWSQKDIKSLLDGKLSLSGGTMTGDLNLSRGYSINLKSSTGNGYGLTEHSGSVSLYCDNDYLDIPTGSGTIAKTSDITSDTTHLLTSGVADAYDEKTTSGYAVGDFCTYQGKAYICKTPIDPVASGSTHAWNSEEWVLANLSQLFSTGNTTLTGTIEETVPATALKETDDDGEYELDPGAANPWDEKASTISCGSGDEKQVVDVVDGDANITVLFSSENTSLNLNNVRVAADDSTTAKSYIDTKLGDVETALAAL